MRKSDMKLEIFIQDLRCLVENLTIHAQDCWMEILGLAVAGDVDVGIVGGMSVAFARMRVGAAVVFCF